MNALASVEARKEAGILRGAQCAVCGHASGDRQYHAAKDRLTCERCLLDSRKAFAGLVDAHPYEVFAECFVEALDLREHETGMHSKRVAAHTLLLARHHYADASTLREIYWGGLLHDIGKIGVPDAVLLKPGGLSEAEWRIMRMHPEYGGRILDKLPLFSLAAQIVRCHEERYDGGGYPAGLKGDAIPLPARLFAVIDTLDAMTFDRPYRKAVGFDEAKREIVAGAGSQFDPLAVDAFIREEPLLREMTQLGFPSREVTMNDFKVGQELEVRLPIDFEGKSIPAGARVRVGAILTELFEPNVALVVVGDPSPQSLILPRHVVALHCTPAP